MDEKKPIEVSVTVTGAYYDTGAKEWNKIQERWAKMGALDAEYKNLLWEQADVEKPKDRILLHNSYGVCINDWRIVVKDLFDCSVGHVRKLRNGVTNDTGTCETCPYFWWEKEYYERALENYKKKQQSPEKLEH